MSFPKWFKYVWWVLLLSLLTYFIYPRIPDLRSGDAMYTDVLVLVLWIPLAFAPIYQEISLPGLSVLAEIVRRALTQQRCSLMN
jgi:hypothetical protein